MKPLKFSEVIKETAQRLQQPEAVVEAVLKIYFKDLRASLTNLSYPYVQVMNLGTFSLKPYTIQKRLQKRQALLGRLEVERGCGRAIQQEASLEIEQMKRALAIISSEKERKKQLKQNRSKQKSY